MLDTIFPQTSSNSSCAPTSEDLVKLYFEDAYAKASALSAVRIRAGFAAIALSPLVTVGRFSTIDQLDRGSRELVIESLSSSSVYFLRRLAMLAKETGAMMYCEMDCELRPFDVQSRGLGFDSVDPSDVIAEDANDPE